LFSEEFIALAILRLVEMEKAVVEGAGAIGLAAVLGNYVPELTGKKCSIRAYYQPFLRPIRELYTDCPALCFSRIVY